MKRMLALGLVLVASAVVVVTTSPPIATPVAAATANVDVIDDAYSPATISIAVGDTVVWTWMGSNQHTVSSNSTEVFDSGAPQTTGTFSHTFNTPGSFAYICGVHGTAMAGTVNVQAAATNTPVPPTSTAVPPSATSSAATNTPSSATNTPAASATSAPGTTPAAIPTPIQPTRVAVDQAVESAPQQQLPRAGAGAFTSDGARLRWLTIALAAAGIAAMGGAAAVAVKRWT